MANSGCKIDDKKFTCHFKWTWVMFTDQLFTEKFDFLINEVQQIVFGASRLGQIPKWSTCITELWLIYLTFPLWAPLKICLTFSDVFGPGLASIYRPYWYTLFICSHMARLCATDLARVYFYLLILCTWHINWSHEHIFRQTVPVSVRVPLPDV